jgi:hypothetical protein
MTSDDNWLSDIADQLSNAKKMFEDAMVKKDSKPLPQVRGRVIDGIYYVRGEDIADALDSQAPRVNKPLIDKLRARAKDV